MPSVTAQGKTIQCEKGANLRRVLIDNGIDLYSPRARYVNCMGVGTCGTCAVAVEGEVSDINWRDRTRRTLPPHNSDRPLRLACQTNVIGDIQLTKFKGFWGHQREIEWTPESPSVTSADRA